MTRQAFTLVELIVVITILAILGTLAFMSFQGYAQNSRDSVRISDLTTISKALEFERTKNDFLPLPDNVITLTASGETIGYQGYASTYMLGKIGISSDVLDPLDGENYIYVTDSTKREYQLLGYLEGELSRVGFSQTYADKTTRNAVLKGKEIGVIVKSDTGEAINKTFSGSSFDYYTSDNNHKVLFGRASKDQIVFSDTNREELAYYNKRSCRALYNYGSYDGSKIYDIYPEGVKVEAYCDMANGGGEVRNFRTFDGLNDYVEIPALSASGDFEFSAEFVKYVPNNKVLLGDDHQNSLYFNISTNVTVWIAGTSYSFGDFGGFIDGKLHSVNYKLVGNELTVTLDGVSVTQTVVPYTGINNFRIGSSNSNTSSWDGIIANVNFKSGWTQNGVANANPYYKLDDANDVLKNHNTELGDELLLNNTFINGINHWTVTGGGSVEILNNRLLLHQISQYSTVYQSVPTIIGDTYLLKGNLSLGDLGYLQVRDLSTSNNVISSIAGDGPVASTFEATTNIAQFRFHGHIPTPLTYSFGASSIKRAQGYGTYNNFVDSSIEKFSQDATGSWLGENIWDDSNAVIYGNATKLPMGAQISVNASEGAGYRILNILDIGQRYKIDLRVENYIDGNIAENSSGFHAIGIQGDGNYSYFTNPVTITQANLSRAGSSCHYDIANVSWRKFLEVSY